MDDNKVIRQLIRVNLELEGFEVVTAADGAECLEVVHRVRPDVITLDVVMPRLDGLRTAARLRADPRTRALPLLIVSACGPREVGCGSEVVVDGFLAKPFEPAELVRSVRRLLERVRAEGKRAEPERPDEGPAGPCASPVDLTGRNDLDPGRRHDPGRWGEPGRYDTGRRGTPGERGELGACGDLGRLAMERIAPVERSDVRPPADAGSWTDGRGRVDGLHGFRGRRGPAAGRVGGAGGVGGAKGVVGGAGGATGWPPGECGAPGS